MKGQQTGSPVTAELHVKLPRSVASAARARSVVRRAAERAGHDGHSVDNAVLVVSELVTNALRHGEGEIDLAVRVDGASMLIEVADQGAADPTVRRRSGDQTSGWGLQLVEALARRWGISNGPTHVWAELSLEIAA